MGMLTTNAVLGGITFVVAMAKLSAAIWLTKAVLTRTRRLKSESRPRWSRAKIIMHYPAVRMLAGAAVTFYGAFIIFALRIPLRGVREAGNLELGDAWLRTSIIWELPAMALVVTGMAMVMWPAFDKYASTRNIILILLVIVAICFGFGALIVEQLSSTILSTWEGA